MNNSLYDPELDAAPGTDSLWDWRGWFGRRSGSGAFKTIGAKSTSIDANGRFREWIARLSTSEVIVLGLSCGGLLSIPVVIAFKPDNLRTLAILLGLLILFPALTAAKRQLKREFVPLKKNGHVDLKAIFKSKAKRYAEYGVIPTIVFMAVVSAMASRSERRPVVPASPNPVLVLPSLPNRPVTGPQPPPNRFLTRTQAPPAPAAAGPDAADRTLVPVVDRGQIPVPIPPLVEEPVAPVPSVSAAELGKLRARYRQASVATLEPIMAGVRRTCDSGDWQRQGWRDYQLEFALDELIYRIKRIAEQPGLALPVRFGDVPAGIAESPQGVLAAMHSKRLQSTSGSILLVDGDLDLPFVKRCLILATGKVTIRHGAESVIIAGNGIEAYDENSNSGLPGKDLVIASPSLWISGTTIKTSSGRRMICGAPQGFRAYSIQQVTLVNSPIRELTHVIGCAEYSSWRIDFRVARTALRRD